MNRDEVKKIAMMVSDEFDDFEIDENRLDFWAAVMFDVTFEEATSGLISYSQSGFRRAPKAGEIRKRAIEARSSNQLTAEQAYRIAEEFAGQGKCIDDLVSAYPGQLKLIGAARSVWEKLLSRDDHTQFIGRSQFLQAHGRISDKPKTVGGAQ